MTCHEARNLLPELAGEERACHVGSPGRAERTGRLAVTRADAARDHAASCDACSAELVELTAAVALCRRAGPHSLPEGFTLDLHRRLVAAGAPRPRLDLHDLYDRIRDWRMLRPLRWALVGAATTLLVVGGLRLTDHRPATATTLAYRVPESKVALVKIDFVAERTIDDVAFELTLPDGLRFYSGGQQLVERSVRWQGRLNVGSNLIPVAVKGPRAGRYRVIAHAIGADLDVTHEVWLEVTT
jgi:hypothetical protein